MLLLRDFFFNEGTYNFFRKIASLLLSGREFKPGFGIAPKPLAASSGSKEEQCTANPETGREERDLNQTPKFQLIKLLLGRSRLTPTNSAGRTCRTRRK